MISGHIFFGHNTDTACTVHEYTIFFNFDLTFGEKFENYFAAHLGTKKPAQGWFLLFCGEKDLNLHGITSISPSS